MVTLDRGKSGLALLMGGGTNYPQWCGIGSTSGAELATLGSLYGEILSERKQFTTRDNSTVNKVVLTFDYDSVTLSGLNIKEFGVATGSTVVIEDFWNIDTFPGVNFDGSNELQIEITYETF